MPDEDLLFGQRRTFKVLRDFQGAMTTPWRENARHAATMLPFGTDRSYPSHKVGGAFSRARSVSGVDRTSVTPDGSSSAVRRKREGEFGMKRRPPPEEDEPGLVQAVFSACVQGAIRAILDFVLGRWGRGLF